MVGCKWCVRSTAERSTRTLTTLVWLLVGVVPMAGADWRERAKAGRTLFQQSNWEAARREFKAALAQAEAAGAAPIETAEVVHAIGCTEYYLGQFRSAKEYLVRAAAAAQWESDLRVASLIDLATISRHLGELKLAQATAMRILEANPGSAVGWLQLGQIYFERRDLKQAEEASKRALELAAGSDPAVERTAINDLATIYIERREYTEAERLLVRILDLSRGSHERANIRTSLARLHWATGRRDEALRGYETALQEMESVFGPSHPETGVLLTEYSFMLKKAGRKQESREMGKRSEAIRSAFTYQANTTGASIDWRDLK